MRRQRGQRRTGRGAGRASGRYRERRKGRNRTRCTGGIHEAEVDVEREHGRLLEVERKGAHDGVDGDFTWGHGRGGNLGGAHETKTFV